MKTKFKTLLTVASASMLAAPLLSAACGAKGRFDQNDDKKIIITSGFSETNKQGRALQAIVDYYNANVVAPNNLYPIEIVRVGGYTTTSIVQGLKARDKSGSIGNLIFNYPAAAAEIAEYDMSLDFKGISGLDNIAKQFLDINKKIAGINDGEIVFIPTSKSTSILTINLPLLGKIISDLEAKGLAVDKSESNTIINKAIEKWSSASEDADKAMINKKWDGAFDEKSWNEAADLRTGFTLSDTTFGNWNDYLKFITIVRSYYNPEKVSYIASTDSFPNDFYTSAAQNGITLFPKTNAAGTEIYGGFDFTSYKKSGTAEYDGIKKIFDIFNPAISTSSLIINGDGSYGSTRFSKHEYLATIGSSAGVSYNYVSGKAAQVDGAKFINSKFKDKKNDLTEILTDDERKTTNLYVVESSSDDGIKFIDGSYQNSIYLSTNDKQKPDKLKHDGKLTSAEQDATLKAFGNGKNYVIVVADANSTAVSADSKGIVTFKGIQLSDKSKFLGEIDFRLGKKQLYLIDPAEFEITLASASSFVNSDEVYNLMAPTKATAESDKSYIVGQGPSIIGIHSNATEDEQTRKFVEWFISTTVEELRIPNGKNPDKTDKFQTFTNKKPIDIFNEFGNYLNTTKEFFDQPKGLFAKEGTPHNLIFKAFQALVTHPETNFLVEDPGATEADRVRKAISTTAKSLVTGNKVKPAEALVKFRRGIE